MKQRILWVLLISTCSAIPAAGISCAMLQLLGRGLTETNEAQIPAWMPIVTMIVLALSGWHMARCLRVSSDFKRHLSVVFLVGSGAFANWPIQEYLDISVRPGNALGVAMWAAISALPQGSKTRHICRCIAVLSGIAAIVDWISGTGIGYVSAVLGTLVGIAIAAKYLREYARVYLYLAIILGGISIALLIPSASFYFEYPEPSAAVLLALTAYSLIIAAAVLSVFLVRPNRQECHLVHQDRG